MSKGNPRVTVRLSVELQARIEEQIERTNKTRFAEPLDLSEWIRAACEEKLAKMARSRRSR